MRIVHVIAELIFLLAFISGYSTEEENAVAAAAKTMKAGEWKVLETKGFDKDLLLSGRKQPQTILPYANKAAWDAKTQTVSYIGMCHMTPPLKHIQYNVKENKWEALPPTWYPDEVWFHAYDNSTAANGMLYHNFKGEAVWQYDIVGKEWKALPPLIRRGSHGATLTCFPDMGEKGSLVCFYGRNPLQFFDIKDQKWTMAEGNLEKAGGLHNVSMYNSVRKSVIVGGGNHNKYESKTLYELTKDGKTRELKECPVMIRVSSTNFAIDPVRGDILVYNFDKENKLYTLDLNDEKAEWVSSEVHEIVSSQKGNSVVSTLSEYGVTMWFNHKGVVLYKHQ